MILVTGATGFLGQRVVRHLARAGRTVRAVSHRRSAERLFDDLGVETLSGDLLERSSLERACQGIDQVIHLAAILRERGAATFQLVNHEGTRRLLAAAREAGVSHFLHMSVIGAGPEERYPYLRSRWQAEEAVRASGLPYTILRASLLFGPGDQFFTLLARFLQPPFFLLYPIVGSGRTRFHPLHVEDMARCIVEAAGEKRLIGQTLELGGPEQMTLEEMVDLMMAVLEVRRAKVHLPIPLLWPGIWLLERLGIPTPATAEQLRMLGLESVADMGSVERHFGFAPLSLRDGLGYLGQRLPR